MSLHDSIKHALTHFPVFAEACGGITLRQYQQGPAQAIIESVRHHYGDTIVVIFPRQSGKNELQAHVEAYLLLLFSQLDGEIVKVSPTRTPQSVTSMRRLERILSRNVLTRGRYDKEQGYIYRIGSARAYFLSANPGANVAGHTANVLLSVDEAQDVDPDIYDRSFFPMTASTHATRVFWGTPWTTRTLLAREERAAREDEQRDGRHRVFRLTADDVMRELPPYALTVADQVRKLGRQHPNVKTQFFCEEIDAQGGLFDAARRALMAGQHPPQTSPTPGETYAFLLDVAGEDETGGLDPAKLTNPARDATALTIVQVEPTADDLCPGPTYRVVARRQWVGVKHTTIFPQLKALADLWQPRYIVADATGVGAGLVSFLDHALPGRVLPFVFNARTKSDLGFAFVAVIETGRFQDYAPADAAQHEFVRQLEHVTYEARENQTLSWSVPDGTRVNGELVHDDYVLSAALCAELDAQPWGSARAIWLPAQNPLAGMQEIY